MHKIAAEPPLAFIYAERYERVYLAFIAGFADYGLDRNRRGSSSIERLHSTRSMSPLRGSASFSFEVDDPQRLRTGLPRCRRSAALEFGHFSVTWKAKE